MQKCCKNSFAFCEDFIGCPEALIIKVPSGYPLEDIIVRVYKDGKVASDVSTVIDEGGFVTVYSEDLPDGFINPFGATYSIQFILFSSGSVYEFMVDGSVYDAIDFIGIAGEPLGQEFVIDIF
jgi:hypothetical protein